MSAGAQNFTGRNVSEDKARRQNSNYIIGVVLVGIRGADTRQIEMDEANIHLR